jgi:hypothetical protein
MMRLLAACAVASVMAGCGGGEDDSPRQVEYTVSDGTLTLFSGRAAHITYAPSMGETAQVDALIPWTYKRTAKPGEFLYVSAQSQQRTGTIYVNIFIDGKPAHSSSSRAAYGVATASGTCCSTD